MKKVISAVAMIAVVALATLAYAQFPDIGSGTKTVEKASRGDVSGATSEAVRGVADAENTECKGKIDRYHRNVEFNVTNGGPAKIKSSFGPCKVSSDSPTYWATKCDYKKFNYIKASCNKTNCSVYCYKK